MSRCVDHKVDSAEDLKQISINPNDGTSFLWDLCSISKLFASKADPVETVVENMESPSFLGKTEQILQSKWRIYLQVLAHVKGFACEDIVKTAFHSKISLSIFGSTSSLFH